MARPTARDRYVVFAEVAVGWVAETTPFRAYTAAVEQFGDRIVRLQKENASDTDARLDQARLDCARWRAGLPVNNDAEADGA